MAALEEVIARSLSHAEGAHDLAAEVGGYDGSGPGSPAERRLARTLSWVFSHVLPRTADRGSLEFPGLCSEFAALRYAASSDDLGIAVEAKRAAILKSAAKLASEKFSAGADMGACFSHTCGQGCRGAEEHMLIVRDVEWLMTTKSRISSACRD